MSAGKYINKCDLQGKGVRVGGEVAEAEIKTTKYFEK